MFHMVGSKCVCLHVVHGKYCFEVTNTNRPDNFKKQLLVSWTTTHPLNIKCKAMLSILSSLNFQNGFTLIHCNPFRLTLPCIKMSSKLCTSPQRVTIRKFSETQRKKTAYLPTVVKYGRWRLSRKSAQLSNSADRNCQKELVTAVDTSYWELLQD